MPKFNVFYLYFTSPFPFFQNTVYFGVCEESIAAQKATEVKLYDLHWLQSQP